MEGLEGVSDVVFKGNGGHVEAVAAVSVGQSEVFDSVDEMCVAAAASHRLDDESLVFQRDEASVKTTATVWTQTIKAKSMLQIRDCILTAQGSSESTLAGMTAMEEDAWIQCDFNIFRL